jgi:hypothetical protein
MRKIVIGVSALLISSSVFAKVSSSDLPNNLQVESMFRNVNGTGSFTTDQGEVSSKISLNGRNGTFTYGSKNGSLRNVRFMTPGEAISAASRLDAQGINVSNYGLGTCNFVVAADWKAGQEESKVFWCFQSNTSGSRYEGIYWKEDPQDPQGWENITFKGIWTGTVD